MIRAIPVRQPVPLPQRPSDALPRSQLCLAITSLTTPASLRCNVFGFIPECYPPPSGGDVQLGSKCDPDPMSALIGQAVWTGGGSEPSVSYVISTEDSFRHRCVAANWTGYSP